MSLGKEETLFRKWEFSYFIPLVRYDSGTRGREENVNIGYNLGEKGSQLEGANLCCGNKLGWEGVFPFSHNLCIKETFKLVRGKGLHRKFMLQRGNLSFTF